jgi:uncharacterized C2H2 Zn-finger protein
MKAELNEIKTPAVRPSISCPRCGGTFTSKKILERHAKSCKGKQAILDLEATA